MMMVVKKKQLVIAAMAIVVGVAGYLNSEKDKGAELTGEKYLGEAQLVDSGDIHTETGDFFSQARIDRETGRSRAVETFNSIISNEEADTAAKANAQQGVLDLAENTEKETAVENLLRAKGFEDAVCYINNGMANVVVKTQALDGASAAIIAETVFEQSGIPQEKIKIMEINQ